MCIAPQGAEWNLWYVGETNNTEFSEGFESGCLISGNDYEHVIFFLYFIKYLLKYANLKY